MSIFNFDRKNARWLLSSEKNKQTIAISSLVNCIERKMWKFLWHQLLNTVHSDWKVTLDIRNSHYLISSLVPGSVAAFGGQPQLELQGQPQCTASLGSQRTAFFLTPTFPCCHLPAHILAPELGNNLLQGRNQALVTSVFPAPIRMFDTCQCPLSTALWVFALGLNSAVWINGRREGRGRGRERSSTPTEI